MNSRFNSVLKLAQLYSYSVSAAFDILDSKRTADTICKKISSFLAQNKGNKKINPVKFRMQVAKIAADKLSSIVMPYIKMDKPEFDFKGLERRIKSEQNQDDLQFFLHDIIHEVLSPGSIAKFVGLDDKYQEMEVEILEKMKTDPRYQDSWDTNDDGEEEFHAEPVYSIKNEVYSLEDFIEEDVAEALTNKTKVAENGLYKYIKSILVSTANDVFDFGWPLSEWEFDLAGVNPDDVEIFLQKVSDKVQKDVANVKNEKYKVIANRFFKSVLAIINEISSGLDVEDYYLSGGIKKFLSMAKEFVSKNFGTADLQGWFEQKQLAKEKDRIEELKRKNDNRERPGRGRSISILTDEFKMSILRRWLLAIDIAVDKQIAASKI